MAWLTVKCVPQPAQSVTVVTVHNYLLGIAALRVLFSLMRFVQDMYQMETTCTFMPPLILHPKLFDWFH